MRTPTVTAEFVAGDIDQGVRERLRAVALAQPQRVAVLDAGNRLTFAELAGQVCAVAERARTAGDGRSPVAVLCGHDAAAVATVLGVLLSGRPVLPLDPRTPPARLRTFVTRVGAITCLADDAHAATAREVLGDVGVVLAGAPDAAGGLHDVGRGLGDWADSPAWTRPLDLGAVAALGFTSGSTGRPKVVALDHRHLAGDAWAASAANGCVRPDDVMAHTLPIGFAAGLNVTLAGPLSGATTAMFDVRAHGVGALAGWLQRERVSVLNASPAILRAFVAAGPDPAALASLRCVTTAGEAAQGKDVAALRRLLPPDCVVVHRLGSTETGLIAELRLDAGTPTPPGRLAVGRPIGSTRVRLVDEDGEPVPPGQPGTVEVTRSYLATGYWGDPVATAAAYRTASDGRRSFRSQDVGRFTEAGELTLLGRRDHSVKIRGYLVEPGEVDAALGALPDVVESVTVGRPRPGAVTHQLVTYVVSRAERPSAARLRAQLRAELPGHMVPEAVVFCKALPRGDRGKIDRSALPDPVHPTGGQPPVSDWENVVAQVWARALEVDEVSRDADFFELGGDSLAAEALIAMVVDDLGVRADLVSSALLVEAPTVAQFAARLRRSPSGQDQTVTTMNAGGDLPPLFVVAGGGGLGVAFLPLARRLGGRQPVYGLQSKALERRGIPDWSVTAAARRNVSALRRLQPQGPYFLAGHSFGGLIALEMAQQLGRAGQPVDSLIILDSFPPDPALIPAEPQRSLPRRLRDGVGLVVTGLVPTPGIGQYWRFHRQSQWLARRYHARPYPGRTMVMVADSADRAARAQWEPHISGPLRIHPVDGDHISMLREPYVVDLASAVAAELAAARHQPAPTATGAPSCG